MHNNYIILHTQRPSEFYEFCLNFLIGQHKSACDKMRYNLFAIGWCFGAEW